MLSRAWDLALLSAITSDAHRSHVLDRIVLLINDGPLSGGVLFLFLWWLWFRAGGSAAENRERVIRIVAGLLVAIALARVIQLILPMRPRPLHDPTLQLIPPYGMKGTIVLENWSSFPSDHAVIFFAIATAIWLQWRWFGLVAGVWALAIGAARVYAGYHFPFDILGGAVLGMLVMGAAIGVVLPAPARRVVARVEGWERRLPELFYPTAAFLTYQFMTLFKDAKLAGRAAVALLSGQASG